MIDEFLCGKSSGIVGLPFRGWQGPGFIGRVFEGVLCGDEEHGVSGHKESRNVHDRGLSADLGLSDAEEGFFVSEVDFDVPSPEIELDDFFQVHVGCGANQVSGLAV